MPRLTDAERESREAVKISPTQRFLTAWERGTAVERFEALRAESLHLAREMGRWMEFERGEESAMLETYEQQWFPGVEKARRLTYQINEWKRKQAATEEALAKADARGDIEKGDELYEKLKKIQDEQIVRSVRINLIHATISQHVVMWYPKKKRGGSVKRSESELSSFEPDYLKDRRK